MATASFLDRREFLRKSVAGGAGLVIGVYLPGKYEALAGVPPKDPAAINAWVKIAPDDTTTLLIDKSEMGQGINTALTMILADELDLETVVQALQAVSSEIALGRLTETLTKLAVQHAGDIDGVLHHDRAVEAVFVAQLLVAHRVDAALAGERLDRVAGDQADEEKGQQGDPEEGRDDQADPCGDKAQHCEAPGGAAVGRSTELLANSQQRFAVSYYFRSTP